MVQMGIPQNQIFEGWKKRINDVESLIQERMTSAYDFGHNDQRRFQPGEMTLALCDGVFYEASVSGTLFPYIHALRSRYLPDYLTTGCAVPAYIACPENLPYGQSNGLDLHCALPRLVQKKTKHMEIELVRCGLDSANDAAGMLLAHEWNTWVRMKLGKKKLGRSSWNLSDEDYAQLEHYWQIHDRMDLSFAEYNGRQQAEAALASLALDR